MPSAETVRALVLLFVGIFLLMSFILLTKFRQARRAKVEPIPPDLSPKHADLVGQAHFWAQQNGFEFLGYYKAPDVKIAAWQHADEPTFLCHYWIAAAKKEAFDFVTELSAGISLTTCSRSDGQLTPKAPGKYAQSFTLPLPGLWQRHQEGVDYLLHAGGAKIGQINEPLEVIMTRSVHESLDYVRSLAFWPFRATYWYFIRRTRWHKVAIAEQHRRGWIRLPNEMRDADLHTHSKQRL